MTRFAVAMGSNLGDRIGHLRAGINRLAEETDLVSVSPLYETAPIGGPEQGPYLNAVAIVETPLGPRDLLRVLNEIEAGQGRSREVAWGPRTLDLDLIATDGDPVDDPPRLVIPHPRAAERRFVLEPLSTIWPDAPIGPGLSVSSALHDVVADQGVDLLAHDWRQGSSRGLYWVAGQLMLFALIGLALVSQGSLPEGGLGVSRLVGAVVAAIGLVLVTWSAVTLGASLTPRPEPLAHGEMVVSGPYRWVRHPMYTSVVLVFLGVAVFFEAPVAAGLAISLLAYFALKARYEESQLRIAYPGYRAYQEKVKHRFIPFGI